MNARQILYSPFSGRVQELSISTVGGIVTEAQLQMLIMPDEEQLEVEVELENKGIGFIHEGMPTEIKVLSENGNELASLIMAFLYNYGIIVDKNIEISLRYLSLITKKKKLL